jgi:anthranilate synthase component 2
MVLMIDNYDSFTYNLVQYLGELGAEVQVVRNDEIASRRPGAGAGAHRHLARALHAGRGRHLGAADPRRRGRVPLLGVCLGHQSIGQAFGGEIVKARAVMHGKTSPIHHAGRGRLRRAGRTLRGDPLPLPGDRRRAPAAGAGGHRLDLHDDGERDEIMGVRHRELPVQGVQFHPESILTRHGHALLKNFLSEALAERPSWPLIAALQQNPCWTRTTPSANAHEQVPHGHQTSHRPRHRRARPRRRGHDRGACAPS